MKKRMTNDDKIKCRFRSIDYEYCYIAQYAIDHESMSSYQVLCIKLNILDNYESIFYSKVKYSNGLKIDKSTEKKDKIILF